MKFLLLFSLCFSCFFIISTQELVPLGTKEINQILNAHNKERTLVGAPNLIWKEELALHAQEWALKLAVDDDGLVHRPIGDDPYGENIAYFDGHEFDAAFPVDLWNEEKSLYHSTKITNTNYIKIGHYTQVVWKNTKMVGCGCAKSASGAYFFVCNYDPAGNIINQFPYK